MAVYRRVGGLKLTCGLTACTPGSAPGPTLGNEYGRTLPFTHTVQEFIRSRDPARPRSNVIGCNSKITMLITLQVCATLSCVKFLQQLYFAIFYFKCTDGLTDLFIVVALHHFRDRHMFCARLIAETRVIHNWP